MATTFAELKNSRKEHLSKLSEKLNEANSGGAKTVDERFWTPTVDKAGNGYAVIRFLPEPKGEDVPFVRVWDHGFQGPGGWYIENSLTTLGQTDPVSEYNSELWNSSTDDKGPERSQARKQKRRLKFFSNILVVDDPDHPENNGKVFLYQYGKKIFDKLNDAMNPTNSRETPVNPFDMWTGANFVIKIKNVEGYRNYDTSYFQKSEAISESDEELNAVFDAELPLKQFIDPANFKTYAELQAKLTKVLGKRPTQAETPQLDRSEAAPRAIKALKTAADETTSVGEETVGDPTDGEEESDAFFQKLKALRDK
jgi:hypothetical protein